MWRGIFPGATKIASNRQSLIVSSGFAASQTSAAAAIRRRCRGLTEFSRSLKIRSRLHLYKHQQPTPARDDVDFAERAAPAARQDAEALGDQESGGAALCRNSDAKCSLPFRSRDALHWWARLVT